MNKTALLFLSIATAMMATAAPITPEQALQRAGQTQHKARGVAATVKQPKLVHTSMSVSGEPTAYLFNAADSKGYVVLSADDMAYPMLGYSDEGTIDADNIPPQMQWWLNEYARQIDYARQNSANNPTAQAAKMSVQREAIAPLCKTKWDQISPFNDKCPLYGTERTYTGCVATSMAQVMKYWEYPEKGTGIVSYTSETIQKKLTLNFGTRKFDWANMKDKYYNGYTDNEKDAVAYLMQAAGYAVKMDYSTDASGALAMDIAAGLVKYFNYDGNINYVLRDFYTRDQWEAMLYDNLKNVGPILYGGGSYIGGGHSFVLDGYDGNGFFHFNWGWSGISDGYFSIDALAPSSLGSGGGGGGGYTFTQDAVLGIQPPTGEPVIEKKLGLTQMGSLVAEFVDDDISFSLAGTGPMWVNYNPKTLNSGFGVIIEPQGTTPGETLYKTVSKTIMQTLKGYGGSPGLVKPVLSNYKQLGLADGTYKITMATFQLPSSTVQMTDDLVPAGSEWVPVQAPYTMFNYVTLTKSGDNYSLKCGELPKLKIEGELVGNLYYGAMSKWRVKVTNLSDVEVASGFAPCLADETLGPVLLGESVYLTIPPHETVTKEWDTKLWLLQNYSVSSAQDIGFTFFNEVEYTYYAEEFLDEIKIYPQPSATLSFPGNVKVTGARPSKIDKKTAYVIKDPTNIEVKATPTLQSGAFSYSLEACLCEAYEIEGYGTQYDILATGGEPVYLTTKGDSHDFVGNINYPLMEPNKLYYIVMAYEISEGLVAMTNVVSPYALYWDGSGSGIDGIEDDEVDADAPTEVYTLQGVYVGTSTDGLDHGIYIVRKGGKSVKVQI